MSKHWTEEVAEAMEQWVPRDEWAVDDTVMVSGEDSYTPGWQVDHLGMTMEFGSLQITCDLIENDYAKTARKMLAMLAVFELDEVEDD